MSSVSVINIKPGDVIREFVVKKKLGEGACGTVYLVQNQKNDKIKGAMKVEPIMKSKDDEILKMEVYVIKQLQKSKHVCRLLTSGRSATYSFVIMSLLGKELAELRRRMPDRKMSLPSTLRVGYQCLQSIQDLHSVGFIHRDIKPTNFACGYLHKHIIYIFDFGLARQIMVKDKDGKFKLREPRNKICFRGTVRYCSINVHQYKEQGRHDDLISLIYMLVELLTATLPWKGQQRKEAQHIKETVNENVLFKNCPGSFLEMFNLLKKTTYMDTPNYDHFRDLLKRDLNSTKIKLTDPFEWEKDGSKDTDKDAKEKKKQQKADVKAVKSTIDRDKDKADDCDTVKNLDDSVLTEGDDADSEQKGVAKEDTLDEVAEISKIYK